MSLSAAEQATINQGSIDAANKANAAAGITSAAPAGSSFIDPATNKPATSGTGAAPLMATSTASRAQYTDNVNTLNQATGKGMPTATAPGQSTKAQLGNTVGAAPTPAPGTTINIHAPAATPAATATPAVATDQGGKLPTSDPANAGQPGYDVFGNPVTSTTSPPSSTTGTDATSTATPSGYDLMDPTTKQYLQQNIDSLTSQAAQAKAQVDAATATNNNDPAMLAAAAAIKSRYDQLIQAMTDHNKIVIGSATINSARTGGMQYAPDMNALFMNDAMQRAQDRVTNLKNEEDDLIMKSNEAYKSNDVKALNDAIANYNKVSTDRMAAVRDLLKAATDATTNAQAQAKDTRDFAYKQQQDKQTALSTVQMAAAKAGAPQAVLDAISKSPDQTAAIAAAGQYLQASSDPKVSEYLFYKQQAESAGQQPLSYDAYQTQQDKLANSQAYAKAYATAAGSEAGKASVVPATPTVDPATPGTGLGGTTKGGSILSAAGISIAAFNYLTQGTASMSRMSISQRTQIMHEAEGWLNKNGVDISTFQSQYKAYNDTLQKNIERANQTKIMAGEVAGSADALLSVLTPTKASDGKTLFGLPIDKAFDKMPGYTNSKLGDLSAANVIDLMAGKQVNSSFAQKYSFQIQAMANDLTGYFAAARGASSPDDSDKRDAANVISNGMNSTSVQAFKDSIQANEAKVTGVVNNAVTNSQKQVWSLFGVGDKYASPVNTNDVLIQQNQSDPGGIGDHLNTSTTNPNDPAGLF